MTDLAQPETLPDIPQWVADIQTMMEKLKTVINPIARQHGLNFSACIYALNIGDQTMMFTELKPISSLAGTNPSYNLELLKRRGFVRREVDANDRRRIPLSLTSSGLELCRSMRRALADAEGAER